MALREWLDGGDVDLSQSRGDRCRGEYENAQDDVRGCVCLQGLSRRVRLLEFRILLRKVAGSLSLLQAFCMPFASSAEGRCCPKPMHPHDAAHQFRAVRINSFT
jgi:hypothetical protein